MKASRNRRWNCYSSVIVLFLTFYAIAITCRAGEPDEPDENICAVGLRTPGRTWPKADIFVERGQPLRIYCILNEILIDSSLRNRNASDLVFFREKTLVEQKYITVLNETTIMLYMEQPPPSKDTYYCKLKTNDSHYRMQYKAVCLNEVIIGFRPQKPLNFSCVSYNWDKLVCSWEPAPNHIATRYSLHFQLPGRRRAGLTIGCPRSRDEDNLAPNNCLWDSSTDPIYRQMYEYYFFTLNAENVLGSDNFTYKFHHWAHVPVQPPSTDVGSFGIVGNIDSRDVYVYWQAIPKQLENGDNFTYQVVSIEENGRRLNLQPHKITKTYAMFKEMCFNELKFEIVAANCKGISNNKATVLVPSQLKSCSAVRCSATEASRFHENFIRRKYLRAIVGSTE